MVAPAPAGNILLVWDRLGDYHAARFEALRNLLPDGTVFISDLGESDGLYKWKNPLADSPLYQPLSSKSVEQPDALARFQAFKNRAIRHNIKVAGIAGYGRPEYNLILVWCKMKGIRVVLFAESWYGDKPIFNRLKGRYLSSVCDGFLVSGVKARHHFSKKLGIYDRPIEIGYSVVDNAHFASGSKTTTQKQILCVARFSEEKNLARLIKAFQKAKLSEDWSLKLVGGGPLKEELQKLVAGNDRIILSDWLSYNELPNLYASASFFILPSVFEPWGLVVNEAMSAGLPIALSKQCGCEPDLCSTTNGFSFDANAEDSIVEIFRKIGQTTNEKRQEMGEESKRKIALFSPHTWAIHFLQLTS
jgi:1,2-diacylglycerol 3-alpha-glucosyltransferase